MSSFEIVPFEAEYQSAVGALFDAGLRKQGDTPTLLALQNWFVESKLKGDMGDIYSYYMANKSDEDSTTTTVTGGLTFFVALMENQVVGCVGIQTCSYSQEPDDKHSDVYDSIQPNEVCELVRMSVSSDCRGQHIGTAMVNKVEEWALSKHMKKIVISTLSAMSPARRLYESMGYQLRIETEIENMVSFLGEGNYEKVYVAHYIKTL
jgi:GNAT superfamily N-acetyltransferase